MKLTLRGHHLLCLKGFQGYGYDDGFVENMTRINFIRKQNTTTISITDNPDDICSSCPNLKNNICKNEHHNKQIIHMDEEVLKKITPAKEFNSIELFDKIDELFKTKESVSEICSNCKWHEQCLFYQNLSDNR